jgi:hypothetical protein
MNPGAMCAMHIVVVGILRRVVHLGPPSGSCPHLQQDARPQKRWKRVYAVRLTGSTKRRMTVIW